MENKQLRPFNTNEFLAKNFFAFNDFSKLKNGNFGIKGLLTIFDNDTANENQYVYHNGCYDNFCKNYYEAKNKHIPLDLLHNVTDINHLIGKVTEFKLSENTAEIVGEISKWTPMFNNVVGLIEDQILQGFSDMSYITDGYWSENDLLHVTSCSIVSVALVPVPAVSESKLFAANGTKFNFEKQIEFESENKIKTIFGL
ncbi:MAG TPA: hypothetical protein DCS17_07385 [Flavobacterium sp.]|nr:hypothetical protein [Flavobacterium sp.]